MGPFSQTWGQRCICKGHSCCLVYLLAKLRDLLRSVFADVVSLVVHAYDTSVNWEEWPLQTLRYSTVEVLPLVFWHVEYDFTWFVDAAALHICSLVSPGLTWQTRLTDRQTPVYEATDDAVIVASAGLHANHLDFVPDRYNNPSTLYTQFFSCQILFLMPNKQCQSTEGILTSYQS